MGLELFLFLICLGLIWLVHEKDKEIKDLRASLRRCDDTIQVLGQVNVTLNGRLSTLLEAEKFVQELGDL